MNRSSYFALRINHFLKGFRRKNQLTQTELATQIRVTKSTVSRIENGQDKQILETLSMLERIGQLENMDLGAFLAYLDASSTAKPAGQLFPWQSATLDALAGIKQSLRLDLTTEVMSKNTKEIERLIELLVHINRLPESSLQALEAIIRTMK